MSRSTMHRIWIAFLLTASITVSVAAPALAEAVTVDCGAGDSLQAAINLANSETPLEVHGVCHERIVIDRPITVIGGDPTATIDGSGAAGNTVTIDSDSVFIRAVTIRGAEQSPTTPDSTGSGVFDAGAHNFSLLRVTVEENEGSGIVMFDSYLTITNSGVRSNGSMGIVLFGGCCGIIGADSIVVSHNGDTGIRTGGDQTLVLTNSKIRHNAGAGVFTNEDGYIADSVIRYNGGGVGSIGTGRIVRTRVVDNGGWGVSGYREVIDSTVARNGSGGVDGELFTVAGSRILRNGGPGVACSSCEVTQSRIRHNDGPGIEASGEAKVVDTTIARNKDTGVVAGSTMSITGSLISRNSGTDAGAVRADGTVDLVNSTVRRNSASAGAAFAVAGILNVTNSTIFRNSGSAGVFANAGTIDIDGSIVHAHRGAAAQCTGSPINSGGYNVVMAPDCLWTATDVVANPLLASLASNGGPTATHALKSGSPAIDAIPAAACAATVDQRGEPRPVGSGCDSGAFEVQ